MPFLANIGAKDGQLLCCLEIQQGGCVKAQAETATTFKPRRKARQERSPARTSISDD